MSLRTESRESRKRKRIRSSVPKRLDAIGNGVPLTREVECRAARAVNPAMDGSRLKVRIHLLLDADKLAGPFEIANACGQSADNPYNPHRDRPDRATHSLAGDEFFAPAAMTFRVSESLRLPFGKIVRLHRTCLEPREERFMLV